LILDLVFGHEPASLLELVRRRSPFHVEDLITRPDKLLRFPVASDTPLHLKRIDLPDRRHEIDPAVAGRATNTLFHVDAVIEIDKVGEVMNTRPLERLIVLPACTNRLEISARRKQLRVAIHARLGRRQACARCNLDRRMTVTAIETIITYVMFVGELDRLLSRHERTRHIRGSVYLGCSPKDRPNQKEWPENAEPGERVSAAVEDLRHRLNLHPAVCSRP
jgi:hypothetical protein